MTLKHSIDKMDAALAKMLVSEMSLPLRMHKSCKTYLHEVCERATEENFPQAVRLLTTLSQGENCLDIDDIRTPDFYTPLCVLSSTCLNSFTYFRFFHEINGFLFRF